LEEDYDYVMYGKVWLCFCVMQGLELIDWFNRYISLTLDHPTSCKLLVCLQSTGPHSHLAARPMRHSVDCCSR
jgi:hypothetical protein